MEPKKSSDVPAPSPPTSIPSLSSPASSPAYSSISRPLHTTLTPELARRLPPLPSSLALSPPSLPPHSVSNSPRMDPRPQGGNSGSSQSGSGSNSGLILDALLPRVETRGQSAKYTSGGSDGSNKGGQPRTSVTTHGGEPSSHSSHSNTADQAQEKEKHGN